jgi:hypothetical protein
MPLPGRPGGSRSLPKKASNQNLRGSELTAATDKKVFGWKNIHKQDGEFPGKTQHGDNSLRLSLRHPSYPIAATTPIFVID